MLSGDQSNWAAAWFQSPTNVNVRLGPHSNLLRLISMNYIEVYYYLRQLQGECRLELLHQFCQAHCFFNYTRSCQFVIQLRNNGSFTLMLLLAINLKKKFKLLISSPFIIILFVICFDIPEGTHEGSFLVSKFSFPMQASVIHPYFLLLAEPGQNSE